MADPQVLSKEIDQLLEHYLHLLDQYSNLRDELSRAQASIQQNIARANFTAERGLRYGQDHYDERMQATRTCALGEKGLQIQLRVEEVLPEEELEVKVEGNSATQTASKNPKDPLRMFGILIPQALRKAQADSIRMVEGIVPRLANINKEMEETEIKIRRKRKHKAKAEVKPHTAGEERVATVECAS